MCSLQMIYQSTKELGIRANGTNRKAPLTNGDIYQWYDWRRCFDDSYLFMYIEHALNKRENTISLSIWKPISDFFRQNTSDRIHKNIPALIQRQSHWPDVF